MIPRRRLRKGRVPGAVEDENGAVRTTAIRSAGLSSPARWPLVGAAALGGTGAVVGVILGLFVYAPTALFAGVELGVPAALAGAVLGIAAAGIAAAGRRIGRRGRRSG